MMHSRTMSACAIIVCFEMNGLNAAQYTAVDTYKGPKQYGKRNHMYMMTIREIDQFLMKQL